MKMGVLVSGIAAVAAGLGLTMVFVNNASPYVTIGEVANKGDNVHVVGKIVPASLKQDNLAGEVSFSLKDDTGIMPVKYIGPPQSNLASATQVVVIGSKKADHFEAEKMLVKCPSKYESDTKPKS